MMFVLDNLFYGLDEGTVGILEVWGVILVVLVQFSARSYMQTAQFKAFIIFKERKATLGA